MGEVQHYLPWFEKHGYDIKPMPADVIFEGLGDVVFHNARAFVGHGPRSDQRALDVLGEVVPELEVLGALEIVDDHYFHLAMALGFIDDETVVYYPPAFTPESEVVIQKAVSNAIPVSAEDANTYFACNNLVIGDTVLIDDCTPALRADLKAYGYEAVAVPMSEFKKSGGSLRCLVLSFM
jgi:N-dimethylarginine dimethylaminohydrolase